MCGLTTSGVGPTCQRLTCLRLQLQLQVNLDLKDRDLIIVNIFSLLFCGLSSSNVLCKHNTIDRLAP